MEQNSNHQEILISDVIKMFKGKSKKILILVLIFAILGAATAVIKHVITTEYGATVTFHLRTDEIPSDLLSIIRSEKVIEKLLLEKNGLPEMALCNAYEYNAALKVMKEYKQSTEDLQIIKQDLDNFLQDTPLPDGSSSNWSLIVKERDRLQAVCDEALALLTVYKSANADAVAQDPNHMVKTAEYEKMLADALEAKKSFEENVYLPSLNKRNEFEQRYAQTLTLNRNLARSSTQLSEKLLKPWRSGGKAKEDLKKLNNAITVEYSENGNTFINVTVKCPNDKEFAEFAVNRVKAYMPDLIEENFHILSNANITCTLLTPWAEVKALNADKLWKDIKSFTILFALCALAIYLVAVAGKGYIKRTLNSDAE